MPLISIIAPVYKCADSIDELYARLTKTLPQISHDYEIIFVNDGSPDDAWEIISLLAKNDKKVKGINLSRNFGQHNAISAGLDFCNGEWVVVMDCDLQDQPEEIIKLYNKATEGYDIVLAKRVNRKDNFIKKIFSNLFYKIFSYLSETQYDPTIGTFRILSKKVVGSYRLFNEKLLFFGAMINWLGFKSISIEINHKERKSGKSSYNINRKIKLAINGILSFSDKPLRITIKIGILLSVAAFFFILYKVFEAMLMGTTAMGWSSLIAAIGFSTGLIISVIGIVGLYVGSIFKEVKGRPTYICSEKINIP